MKIWNHSLPPYSNGVFEDFVVHDDKGHIDNVHNPELIEFLLPDSPTPTPAVIILPGGGYRLLSSSKEGCCAAEWLNSFGISAFVLHYRLPIIPNLTERKFVPLSDVQRAMRIIRSNAKAWNIDPNKIGSIGFSAGGHLAASLMTLHDYPAYEKLDEIDEVSAKPNFSLLIYPVISVNDITATHQGSVKNLLGENPTSDDLNLFSPEKNIKPDSGPVFIVHAQDDDCVPVANSTTIFTALNQSKIPSELHIYSKGGHGFGLDQTTGRILEWPDRAKAWLLDIL